MRQLIMRDAYLMAFVKVRVQTCTIRIDCLHSMALECSLHSGGPKIGSLLIPLFVLCIGTLQRGVAGSGQQVVLITGFIVEDDMKDSESYELADR